jgi:hypothetical protein
MRAAAANPEKVEIANIPYEYNSWCVPVNTNKIATLPEKLSLEASEPSSPSDTRSLVLTHYLLQHNCPFRELGADYYQRLRAPSLSQSLVRRWQRLGYQVTLTPAQQAI